MALIGFSIKLLLLFFLISKIFFQIFKSIITFLLFAKRFGAGRVPWNIEPTSIIFLTTGKSLEGKQILLSKGSMSAGSDLYYEPFRYYSK
jgi:hypothetical protein